MADATDNDAQLRVGAHVLVQLGSELVTDVEQAILECVKNAYDADALDCRIDIDTRSLARLISPFEATSTFPVGIKLDGDDQSLVSVTDELLKRAVAEFEFAWRADPRDPAKHILAATARFRKRLFTSQRGNKYKQRTAAVFGKDRGAGFAKSLDSYGAIKAFSRQDYRLGRALVHRAARTRWMRRRRPALA